MSVLLLLYMVDWIVSLRAGSRRYLAFPTRSAHAPDEHFLSILVDVLHLSGWYDSLAQKLSILSEINRTWQLQREFARLDLGRHDGNGHGSSRPIKACQALLDVECTWLLLRLEPYPPLFPSMPRLVWLEKMYQIYRVNQRSVSAVNVNLHLVVGMVDLVPGESDVSEVEENGDMFWWFPVKTIELPMNATAVPISEPFTL